MNSSEILINSSGYKVIRSLLKNEQNEILLASRTSDDQLVVLKHSVMISENLLKVSKLGHEYDILKDLDHKGIPKVYKVLYDGKSVILVQEYIDGSDLREKIFKKEINFTHVLDISIQLADILYYIHQNGVIHKDINPSNLMLTKDGTLKLLDFGISSNLYSETNEPLNVDQIEGTLNYISPEQTGRTAYSVTHLCDYYSSGVLLYELVAGKTPFDSIDPLEIIHFHLSKNPTPLQSIFTDLPTGLDQIISKMMEKNPDDRYHSASGLKADLETVKKHYVSKLPLRGFKPGLFDRTEQYKQNQILYGRENETNELLNYYKNLNQSKSILVLVSGYSGVGKSALIRHIKFPIVQSRGTFLSGKFEQFKKDIPYYAVIEAFQDFIRNLLSETEDKIKQWKQRISSVLGENAGLITEVIPQLLKIIDKQPPVAKLQPAEQETRFHKVLLDFIYVFSTLESPLVLFLDDLQWADLPSLNLVRRILENPRQENILILGAYRNNEVEKGHPLLITLEQAYQSNCQIRNIMIHPLNLDTTCRITADSFDMDKTHAYELGLHVFNKTKGNPFFTHSFLKSLYDNGLVTKGIDGYWIWDQNEIDKLDYTENVIDLMTKALISLPLHTREVLKYAAVLGNTFDLEDLSGITENSQSQSYHNLKPAIQGGYINSNDRIYRALALNSINTDYDYDLQLSGKTAQFSFAHDKVQQAAYNLISPVELPSLHLKIGRLLLQNRDEAQLHEDLFALLNHFAISSHLLEDKQEMKRITELCLIAGRKAKDSTSYNLAVRFLSIARNLLGVDTWAENYELTYNVLIELGECEYLNDNLFIAEQYFKEILANSKTNFDKLKIYYIHSSLYLKIGNTNESLRLGLEAAKLYGIYLPKKKWSIQIATLFEMAKYLFLFSTRYKKPESLFHIKDCTNEETIALNKFLIDLATSAYQQDQNLMMLVIFRIVKSYIRDGFTDASGWGFSGFSVVVLSALKMQIRGFNLWDLTIRLHQRTHSPLIKWRLNYTVLSFNNHWRVSFRQGYDPILETIKACVLNGDQIFTGYSVALLLRWRIASGENLKLILNGSKDHMTLIKNGKGGLDFFQCFYQMAKALNGQTNEGGWDDIDFNSSETLKRLNLEGNNTKLAFFHSADCYLRYFSGHYKEALDQSQVVLKFSDNFLGDLLEVLNAFFTSLSISASYKDLNHKDQKKYKRIFKNHLKSMKFWADGCPENYSSHYDLLLAEKHALDGQYMKAMVFYEKSIQSASQNRFIYVEAIANERAGILCSNIQLNNQAQAYLQNAWDAYFRWGANAKCRQMEVFYQQGTIRLSTQKSEDQKVEVAGNTLKSSKTALDLASILKASQSIAGQIRYDDLLKNLMHITIENAGAEMGCLLLYKGNQLCIEVVGNSGKEGIQIFPSVPLSESEIVPKTMLNYSWRSGENIVVDETLIEERFSLDSYILTNKPLSMMCLTIRSQGKPKGLLYLENRFLKGVFNKGRIELLQMLSGQIGISIENALLYENLEEKVKERTLEINKAYNELKAAQAQLIQSEKMASLGELTAGIAHEIQNPLNFVNNFAEVGNELVDEMKQELYKGNQEMAITIADDLKINLEKINHHGKRADAIVKGMLQHSRSSSGVKEPTDLNALADEYLRLSYQGLRAKDNLFNSALKTEFDPNIGEIYIVSQDIGRVILNLLTNAFYAVREKSNLGIEGYEPVVSIKTRKNGDKIELTVSDNGNGIQGKNLDKIFQPFFTTKPAGEGTGLGLSLSYEIIKKGHGGELKVETKVGEFTNFIVIL